MFIELPTFVILTSVMSAIQISIWKTLPENVRDLIMSNKAGAFIINLAGSNLIVSFTGVASVVGVCNLAASVVFGGYSAYYTKKKGIEGVDCKWVKMWNLVPLYPSLKVRYKVQDTPGGT